LTAHVVVDATQVEGVLLAQARALLAEQFDLPHATLQVEREQCGPAGRCDAGGSPTAAPTGQAHDHNH
jgi:hypothetical protein